MGKWYAGVVHSHTNRSDGKFTPEKLVKLAEKKNLDFLIITDHDQFCEIIPESEKMLVIPGAELTKEGGHTNIWGVQYPIDNFECETYEEWENKIAQAKAKGAVICMNHPLCSNCTWRWPREPEKVDCVEVWNSPQHTDNMLCTVWWQEQLKLGKKIPAVGGSDYHRDYVVTDFLDNPTTYVYAEECTQEAILNAIKAGHCTIAPHVGKTMIEIKCGDAIIGDTVKLTESTKITVSVTELKAGHTLKIIGKHGLIFEHKANKTDAYSVTIPVYDTNFVCAQVEYKVNPVYGFVYNKAVASQIPTQKDQPLPPFIYAQTSAMYFE